jgi:hypothetical protein
LSKGFSDHFGVIDAFGLMLLSVSNTAHEPLAASVRPFSTYLIGLCICLPDDPDGPTTGPGEARRLRARPARPESPASYGMGRIAGRGASGYKIVLNGPFGTASGPTPGLNCHRALDVYSLPFQGVTAA